MARLALHPQLSGVVDVDVEYRMEEIVGRARAARACGQTVGDIRGGSMIVGLRRGADFQPQPPAETHAAARRRDPRDGHAGALERLEELLQSASGRP